MGERKVLNKYFPPDFDPRYVPKTKWDPFKQIETRMMIPFNIQARAMRFCVGFCSWGGIAELPVLGLAL